MTKDQGQDIKMESYFGLSRNKRMIGGIAGVVFTLCLLFILLVTSVEAVCYWTPGYFKHEYEKYDVLSDLPDMTMSSEDGLMAVTEHMMHYLRGDKGYDELQIEVMMDGELRGFFTDREIAHMEDVRELFLAAMHLRICAVVICVLCLVVMWSISKGSVRVFFHMLSKSLVIGTGILLALLAALAFILSTNFSEAFVTFHHIFFDNDLWILDPSVDMLINIVPEGFFYDTAFRIAGLFGASIVVLLGIGIAGLLLNKRDHSSRT